MINELLKLIAWSLIVFAAFMAGTAYGSIDPNWIDPNGQLDVRAIFAALADPNFLPAEPVTVRRPVRIPLTEQWLVKPTMTSTVYPKEVTVKDSSVEWRFVDGQWLPAHTGDSPIRIYHRPRAHRAVIHAGKTRYVIQGEFTVTEIKPDVLSCDLTGDGKVDLLDFAEVSRTWLKKEVP